MTVHIKLIAKIKIKEKKRESKKMIRVFLYSNCSCLLFILLQTINFIKIFYLVIDKTKILI